MDRRRKVELFEQIRREYRFGIGTVRGVAKQLGVHRRMVGRALASAIPPERKVPVRAKPKLDAVVEFIDEILRVDQQAPRKQRHTTHRIWKRIREERPELGVAESTVRHAEETDDVRRSPKENRRSATGEMGKVQGGSKVVGEGDLYLVLFPCRNSKGCYR